MADRASAALAALETLRFDFRRGAAQRKRARLRTLERSALPSASAVLRLHALLCFMRAYPDDEAVLARIEAMLEGFAAREDLRRHCGALTNSGIAGCDIEYRFFWFTLCWLAERWPARLRIDWSDISPRQRALLDGRLNMLMPYCETLTLEEAAMGTRRWIEVLKGPGETDAGFLVRRFEALRVDPLPRESLFEELDLLFRLEAGPDTPSATRSRHARSPVVFQGTRPLLQSRESFRRELERRPAAVRAVSRAEALELIDMARTLMVVRSRDLDAFVHGDERDVRLLEYGEGLQFACIGTRAERRQLLDAAYGFLMLKNGVTVGYVLAAALFGSAEVAFNVSPEFRGAEAAHLYARSLSVVRHLFDVDTFTVDPYQMGHDNEEGLKSGAWWFYYKLGFRPRDPAIARLAEAEARLTRETPGHRSGPAKLGRLSSVNMYLSVGEPRQEILGQFVRENIGLRITRSLAQRFGAERERGIESCAREAARRLGVDALAGFTPEERLAWERWSPLLALLPELDRWPEREVRALVQVVRAKGGRRESEFVRAFDRHARLRRAIWVLAQEPPPLPA